MLVQATALLDERPVDLTEEQKQYYLQYLAFYGYPFDPKQPFRVSFVLKMFVFVFVFVFENVYGQFS